MSQVGFAGKGGNLSKTMIDLTGYIGGRILDEKKQSCGKSLVTDMMRNMNNLPCVS